jgi:hypothetical protein
MRTLPKEEDVNRNNTGTENGELGSYVGGT